MFPLHFSHSPNFTGSPSSQYSSGRLWIHHRGKDRTHTSPRPTRRGMCWKCHKKSVRRRSQQSHKFMLLSYVSDRQHEIQDNINEWRWYKFLPGPSPGRHLPVPRYHGASTLENCFPFPGLFSLVWNQYWSTSTFVNAGKSRVHGNAFFAFQTPVATTSELALNSRFMIAIN